MSSTPRRYKILRGATGNTVEPLGETPELQRGDDPIEVVPASDYDAIRNQERERLKEALEDREVAEGEWREGRREERQRIEKLLSERNLRHTSLAIHDDSDPKLDGEIVALEAALDTLDHE